MAFNDFKLFSGSQSTDIPHLESAENPLPACPDTHNCVRITKKIDQSCNIIFTTVLKAVESMKPAEMKIDKENIKIEMVFSVFLFKDDMTVQVQQADTDSSYIYIRSASRIGESDLGVNTSRVKWFLQILNEKL